MTGTRSSSANRVRSVGVLRAGAGQDQRALCAGQQVEHRANVVVGWTRGRRSGQLDLGLAGDHLVEQVLGERQEHRTRPATERLAYGLGKDVHQLLDGARLDGPLRELAERTGLIDLLEGLPAAIPALDLADEDEQRGRVLFRGMDADGHVRGADGASSQAYRGPAGQLAVGLGHERRSAFVACGDDPDPCTLEGVENAEEALARNGERIAHAC